MSGQPFTELRVTLPVQPAEDPDAMLRPRKPVRVHEITRASQAMHDEHGLPLVARCGNVIPPSAARGDAEIRRRFPTTVPCWRCAVEAAAWDVGREDLEDVLQWHPEFDD